MNNLALFIKKMHVDQVFKIMGLTKFIQSKSPTYNLLGIRRCKSFGKT